MRAERHPATCVHRATIDRSTPQMALFEQWLAREQGLRFADYQALWSWSVTDQESFWQSIWDYHGIESPTPHDAVLRVATMPGARWFDGASVNYAREVFRHAALADAAGQPAIIAENEAGDVTTLSWSALGAQVASLALELRRGGIGRGDRVAACLPNIPETIVAFLACASLGAIWSLCSPDMGSAAILDRFRQIEPKALLAVDAVRYAGRVSDRRAVLAELRAALPTAGLVVVVRSGLCEDRVTGTLDFASAAGRIDAEVEAFEPEWLPFDHPLWILYSSGTTGLPKAIVQGHGGIILSAHVGAKHNDIGPSYVANSLGDRFHWYSSTGWVMWNAQVGGLLGGTTICIYDGSPSGAKQDPDWSLLWRFASRHRVTWFGAGAAFYASCRKAGLTLHRCGDLRAVRALGSTGSPLPAEVQLWGSAEFEAVGRGQIWWSNISGGTDLCANFAAGNRMLPATPGKLQCRQLGAAVEAWSEDGESLTGAVGELVCTKPYPSMPLYLWGDTDGERYRASYFDVWPGIWRHGDWLQIDADGSCTISGRSDATINRHGLRMGTSELYSAVEQLSAVADSLVVDVEDGQGGSRLVMFVVPAAGEALDKPLVDAMSAGIRKALSPRFIPDHFVVAPGIPRTLSGKKQELPVKRLFQGAPLAKIMNLEAMANPEVMPWYVGLAEAWRKDRWDEWLADTAARPGEASAG